MVTLRFSINKPEHIHSMYLFAQIIQWHPAN